ncbi:tryptophan halogenase family protein [Pseudoteredinibacter isoporae]|uniref:tryptophan halogenase family protein n=1 Tax=Pseudoteredinibacter isoporae TaxID=570281 RepID=UPI00310A6CD3
MSDSHHTMAQSILIVGGGTAGWITANLLKKRWPEASVTLIESQQIGTVGVGEGSTPAMKLFFSQLGIPESEWMPACNATFKTGISFPNWTGDKEYSSYFHPFYSHFDLETAKAFFKNCDLRRQGFEADANPDKFWLSARLALDKRAPKTKTRLPFELDYAYHFDAGALGEFLRQKALSAGVRHLEGDIEQVELCNESGCIDRVHSKQHGPIKSDVYIDCSGFRSILLQQAMNVPFHSYEDRLFNDRAVAILTNKDRSASISAQTVSSGMQHGWRWQIPLRNRDGNGYVYSSSHCSPEQAEQELRRELNVGDEVAAKHLRMKVGRNERHWEKNCLAVGLSQGFIEPLEATALMLVQFTVEQFVSDYHSNAQDRYNRKINQAFDAISDYVQCHYKINSRRDTDYWIENRENTSVSDQLSKLLECWTSGGDLDPILSQYQTSVAYLKPSWYTIFSGMGFYSNQASTLSSTMHPSTAEAAPADMAAIYCEEMAAMFEDHRQFLNKQ